MRKKRAIPETSESHGQSSRAGTILGLDNLVTTELNTCKKSVSSHNGA